MSSLCGDTLYANFCPDSAQEKQVSFTDQGFSLHYEDFDRPGTAGVSTKLKAQDIVSAVKEAREFLAAGHFPEQTRVNITHSYGVDVSDLKIGQKLPTASHS